MIRSFKDRETQRLNDREVSRKFPPTILRAALRMIQNAQTLDDLRIPPANRLEKLKGDRSGQHSIRINDQWRICFRWKDGDAFDVEIVDYHS